MAERGGSSTAVPGRGDPDRKRALNVLAQRRYRQRRREKIHSLQSRVNLMATSLPQAASTPLVSKPMPFGSFGILTPARSERLPTPEGWANQNNSISNDLNITNDSTDNSRATVDLLNFDLAPFSPWADFGSELQSLESSQFTFPDDGTLDVPELQVMKAGLNIAEMLGCSESLWDFSALRVLDKSSISTPFLPPNLEPTEVQRRIPHHPLFDLFPWPSVRTKLVIVFSQPLQTRPPAARDPMALMQLFYDMDDSAEGLRISGEDCYSEENWEIGQAFFTNWWWALDRSVVDSSNALRAKRGAQRLMLGPS